jgi:hypothetical protein
MGKQEKKNLSEKKMRLRGTAFPLPVNIVGIL